MRRPTSYDVARAAGVAQSTVSRCFRDDGGISDDTRTRVHAIAVELGYTPNAVARSLILRRSNVVALIVTDFTLRTNPNVIHGISQALAGAGKRLLLMTVEGDHDVAGAVRGAMEYPIDGLITGALIADDDLRRFLARGVPVVFLNRRVDRPRVDCVTTDHPAATGEVAEMLHTAGFRHFLCMTGPADSAVSMERVSGFRARMETLGDTRIEMCGSGFGYDEGRAAFIAHVAASPRPDAVFATNDQLAFGVMDACRYDLAWRVPDDVSVVGFDDLPEAARPGYELTTVRQQFEEIGRAAIELLVRRMAVPEAPARTVLLPGTLKRRGSARLI